MERAERGESQRGWGVIEKTVIGAEGRATQKQGGGGGGGGLEDEQREIEEIESRGREGGREGERRRG